MVSSSGFSRYAPQVVPTSPQPERARSLLDVIRDLDGASTELVERNKTIFFPPNHLFPQFPHFLLSLYSLYFTYTPHS